MNKQIAMMVATGVSFTVNNLPVLAGPANTNTSSAQTLRFYTCGGNGEVFTAIPNYKRGGSGGTLQKVLSINDADSPFNGFCNTQVGVYVNKIPASGLKVKSIGFDFTSRRPAQNIKGQSSRVGTQVVPPQSALYGNYNGPFVVIQGYDAQGYFFQTISNPLTNGYVKSYNTGTIQPSSCDGGVALSGPDFAAYLPTPLASNPPFGGGVGTRNGLGIPDSASVVTAIAILTTHNGSFFISNVKVNGQSILPDTQILNANAQGNCVVGSDEDAFDDYYQSCSGSYIFDGNCGSGSGS